MANQPQNMQVGPDYLPPREKQSRDDDGGLHRQSYLEDRWRWAEVTFLTAVSVLLALGVTLAPGVILVQMGRISDLSGVKLGLVLIAVVWTVLSQFSGWKLRVFKRDISSRINSAKLSASSQSDEGMSHIRNHLSIARDMIRKLRFERRYLDMFFFKDDNHCWTYYLALENVIEFLSGFRFSKLEKTEQGLAVQRLTQELEPLRGKEADDLGDKIHRIKYFYLNVAVTVLAYAFWIMVIVAFYTNGTT